MPKPEYDITSYTTLTIDKEYFLHPELAQIWINCGHCELAPQTPAGAVR